MLPEITDALKRAEELVSSLRRLLDLTLPTVPQNVSASANGSTVTLTWDTAMGAPDISHYKIYRNSSLLVVDDHSPYEDSGLANGTYSYQVSAVDRLGRESALSTASQVTVAVIPPNPDVPINFLASAASATGINLSWAAGPAPPAPTDYDLDFATAGASGPWTPITIGLQTSYSHTALTTAQQYWYRLLAKNGAFPADAYATATETTDGPAQVGAANFIIPNTVSSWDGAEAHAPEEGGAARAVRAGDIIEFQSGTYDAFTLSNIVGSVSDRITIRGPQTGRATFRRTAPSGGGHIFRLNNVRRVNFTGQTSDTGVTAGPDGKRRSIRVMYASGATSGNKDGPSTFIKFGETVTSSYTATRNITLSYVEVDGGWPTLANNGAAIGTNTNSSALTHAGLYQESIILEHNYLHDVAQEGLYCGPNVYHWSRSGHTPEVPLRYIKCRYNYVADTGSDGLLFKSIFDGTPGADGDTENSCHDNTLLRVGQNVNNNGLVGGNGISTSSAKINIYNNYITRAGDVGIRYSTGEGSNVGDPSGTYTGKIYNNVVVRAGDVGGNVSAGINVRAHADLTAAGYPAPTGQCFNNTCLNSTGSGIQFAGSANSACFARNNICLGNDGSQISVGPGSATNNTTTGTQAATFVSPPSSVTDVVFDLHLLLAITATGTIGTDISATDIEGTARVTPDRGAYEFV